MQNTSYREKCKIPVTGNNTNILIIGSKAKIPVTGTNAKYQLQGTMQTY
jgi:hypothetical protein